MSKKISLLLFAICIITSVFAIGVLAEGEAPEAVTTATMSTEAPTGTSGYTSAFSSAMRYEMLFLLAIVVLCYFETLLSNKESSRPGLILPIVAFIAMTVMTIIFTIRAQSFSIPGFIMTLLLLNIPTIILLLIYHFSRKKYKKEKSL